MQSTDMPEHAARKPRSLFLTVLCVLTILGNLLIVFKGLITYYVLDSTNDDRQKGAVLLINVVYSLELITCVGSIAGALLMLQGKKKGLLTYLYSSMAYIVLTFVFAIVCFFSIVGIPLGFLQIIYLIPSIVFFILYLFQEKHLS